VLTCFWSPKGGSGTSVVVAATGLVMARAGVARIVDLAGDQPAVLGLANDPSLGVRDWLRAGVQAPADALAHLAVEAAPNLSLLPAGLPGADDVMLPEAGAALAVALAADPVPTVCDLGRLDAPVLEAFAEVAGPQVLVLRGCYLALRRASRHPGLQNVAAVVLIDEHGRSLGTRDVEDVLGVPVAATITARSAIARAVDAGVLGIRMPEGLARPLQHAFERSGWFDAESAA
jgi:hypothetical protein